jgi:hypothetical protein
MLKSNFWFLFCLLACTPQQEQKVVSHKWLEGRNEFATMRTPASGDNPSCRHELFNLAEVKREALHYESQLNTGKKIIGDWKHLELKKLPIPQAKLLKEIGDDLGDLNHPGENDYSDCQDAICVINKVYKSKDGLEGWMTYLWYLKMGYRLSLKNKIYEQKDSAPGSYDGKVYPLNDYLFSRDELYAFWRMSHALTSPFKNLPKMIEIQRIPRKSKIEGRGAACGLAWSSGYVQVNDACLSFWGDKDTGFIYEGVTHELGHQIDYQFAEDIKSSGSYYSHVGTWKEIGGWSQTEYFDEERKETVQEWVSTLRNDQFVREYARTSPAEHFADTIAYYRYSGDTTKRKIPTDVYEHLQKKVFDGLEYDRSGLFNQFEKDLTILLAPATFKAVIECDQNPIASAWTKPLDENAFPFALDVNSRRCLREKLNSLIKQSVVEAKLNHVNGCSALKSNEKVAAFGTQMEGVFLKQMLAHMKIARENQKYYKNINELYHSLVQRTDSLKIMTSCYGQSDERKCYDEKNMEFVQLLIPDDYVNDSQLIRDLQKMYLDSTMFDNVRAENMKLHQDFLITQTTLIDQAAANLWGFCLSKGMSNTSPPIAGSFSVAEDWMVSSQFNCLNREIPDVAKRVVSEMSFKEMRIIDHQESLLLLDLTTPTLVKELSRIYQIEQQKEALEIKERCASEPQSKLSQEFRYHQVKQPEKDICRDFASSEPRD